MDIWITDCRYTVECHHCHQPILLHSPMVVGRYWTVYNANSAAPIHHRHTIHWHVKRESDSICCWIEQGLTELNLKLAEPKVSNRGGKTLLLSSDMRKKRLQLLQRHARLVQMLKEEMEKLATDETTSQPLGSWTESLF